MIRSHLSLDSASAIESIQRVQGLARATGDVDLELAALAELGARLVGAGSVDEGLGLLDEAMSGSFESECQSFLPAVWASCEMLKACEFAGDLRRATEWMRVVDDFTDRYGCPFVYASCRMRYGSLLVAKGRWFRPNRSCVPPFVCREVPGRSWRARHSLGTRSCACGRGVSKMQRRSYRKSMTSWLPV